MVDRYYEAQMAITTLKSLVLGVLAEHPEGLRNVDVGKMLGIYSGHVEHEGHISRTLLEMLKTEGLVRQDKNNEKRWFVVYAK